MNMIWLGQGGFIFERDGYRLAIDPYLSDSLAAHGFPRNFPPPVAPKDFNPDCIVCTHDHGDHFDPDSVLPAVAARPDTVVLGPASVVKHGAALGLAVCPLAPAAAPVAAGPFTLRAVPAHHSDPAAVGLIIEAGGQRVYLTGDSTYAADLAPAALAYGPIDLLLICINGKLGNMTAADAVKVTAAIRPRLALPMHYGLFAVNTADPRTFLDPVRQLGIAACELPLAAPVPANIEPGLYLRAWQAAVAGAADGAALQTETDALWNRLVQGTDFFSGTFTSLARAGIGECRLPRPWTRQAQTTKEHETR